MRGEIRNLQRQLGITMVYVTHDQIEAMSMADRVVLLNGGAIEQNATPVDLYEHPANTFVARFIGTPPMNLMPLESVGQGMAIAGTGGPVVVGSECAGCTLGVRPEHIVVDFKNGLKADVASVEYLGADSLVTCRLGSTVIAARVAGGVGVSRGDAIRISWPPGAQHLFDSAGKRRADVDEQQMTTSFA